jgi:hypothetical protein
MMQRQANSSKTTRQRHRAAPVQRRQHRYPPHLIVANDSDGNEQEEEEEEAEEEPEPLIDDTPPLLPQSIFTPLLLCIQLCLLFEVATLWMHEYVMALAFRLMIGLFVCAAYYFRYHREDDEMLQTQDLSSLLPIVAAQDILVALLTRGLFNLYSWLLIYTPVSLYCLYTYREHRCWPAARDYTRRATRRLLRDDEDDEDTQPQQSQHNIV